MKPLKEPELKPVEIKIKSFSPMAIPNALGQATVIIWGIGDDNKMYQWNSEKKVWVI